ncbi:hypothetical protein MP228_012451 [Amoeboaphelidium protococcarum]|nr:hypothetical protein MP228_012451 [Amoeboaphelidium protococcarum]
MTNMPVSSAKQQMSLKANTSSRIQWLAQQSIHSEPRLNRKTSIICTIGPKTNSVDMMCKLRQAGMNIVRMNFSHGSYEYHGSVIKNARDSFQQMSGRPVAIALDTKGPEIRTGRIKGDQELSIPHGHEMVLTTDPARANDGDIDCIYIDYEKLPHSTDVGKYIFVDDGQLRFQVVSIQGKDVRVQAQNSWKISNNKGVNLPMTTVELPALSERDKRDLQFGIENDVDMIFASFIRKKEDILEIRQILDTFMNGRGKDIKIIAKIESHEGLDNFDEILQVTDGIMVARGDLGIEIAAEKVFIAQKMMIAKCNAVGKPIICATQMLETMTYNPRPTRAEVSDVANAVLDGADCVMLSGETAKGQYPLETVDMMNRLCKEAESVLFYPQLFNELRDVTPKPTTTTEAIASSAVNAAEEQGAAAICVLTTTGESARLISKYRPHIPVITVTRNAKVARQCHLYRGCYPFVYEKARKQGSESAPASPSSQSMVHDQWQEDVDERFFWAMKEGKKLGMLKAGDVIVAVQGWRGGAGSTSVMRMIPVPDAL